MDKGYYKLKGTTIGDCVVATFSDIKLKLDYNQGISDEANTERLKSIIFDDLSISRELLTTSFVYTPDTTPGNELLEITITNLDTEEKREALCVIFANLISNISNRPKVIEKKVNAEIAFTEQLLLHTAPIVKTSTDVTIVYSYEDLYTNHSYPDQVDLYHAMVRDKIYSIGFFESITQTGTYERVDILNSSKFSWIVPTLETATKLFNLTFQGISDPAKEHIANTIFQLSKGPGGGIANSYKNMLAILTEIFNI